jgi:pimeloyl-ACP methyl ester carboxylesterase
LNSVPYTTSNGTRLFWDESGQGDPLLLIMGLGYTHEMWFRSRPLLSQRYRTITFDNRGVGNSDIPTGPYSIAQMAADAAAVLDAAQVDRAHIFGISMGGMIAQEFAIAYPARVRSLILGCTACGGRNAIPASEQVLRIRLARATMTPEEGIRAMVPFIYDASTPRELIEEDLAIRLRTYPSADGYLAQVHAIQAWTSLDRLKEIHASTLIIHGESDQLVPPANARILEKHISGSRLVMLPKASHLFPTDQPEISHLEILAFLSASS